MKKSKSIFLSILVVKLLIAVLFISTFFIPLLSKAYVIISNSPTDISTQVTIGLYCLELPAIATMIVLHLLLSNIKRGNVFVKKNTSFLTVIFIGLILVGVICAFMASISWAFAFTSIAFLFVALILLVLRNVFDYAVEIKSENDFTI
ncbi:MAG: DUF2975 domain-containing protein [Acutalibacteraceae bacterium]|nr:DUF2975 domain-containing protein [Acutalibacteraceae bacterium]